MIYKHLTRLRDFLLPVLLIILGGLLAVWMSNIVGVLVWIVALLVSVWLIIVGIINELSELVREKTYQKTEDIRLYQLLMDMDEDQKVQFGLAVAKDTVKLELDRSQQGTYSKGYRILSISPAKLRVLAYSCLNETPFTLRALAGPGKLLSDNEFRILKDELLASELIALRNDQNERQGYYWTEDGKKFLQEVIEVNPI